MYCECDHDPEDHKDEHGACEVQDCDCLGYEEADPDEDEEEEAADDDDDDSEWDDDDDEEDDDDPLDED
jgi:segregation and condensation protein B